MNCVNYSKHTGCRCYQSFLKIKESDYGKTLVNHGMNNVDLYIDMAKDRIEDDDVSAGKSKTVDYYYCIVK